jgi:hypothetical protein
MTRATTQKLSSVASNAPPKSSRKSFDVSHHVDAQSSCDLYSINCSNAQIRDTGTGSPVEFTIKFLESNKEPSREMGSFHCLGHELGRKTLSVPAHSPELRPDSLFTLLHTKIPLLGHFRLRTLLPTLSHETDTASSGSWKMQKGEGRGWLSKKRGRIGEGWFLHGRHFSFRKKHDAQQSTRRQIFCLLAFRARSLVGSLVCTNFHDVLGYRYAFTRRSICTVSIDCNTRYVH